MPTARQLAAQERRVARERFIKARNSERAFSRLLANVGRQVGNIVQGFSTREGTVPDVSALRAAMDSYALVLSPWAQAVVTRMQNEVSQRDLTAWRRLSQAMGSALHREIERAPTGDVMRALRVEQVRLITSLPIEAADRVHDLTQKALISGERAAEIAAEIKRSGPVSIGRARLIARTEVARTASKLTEARSIFVGSEGYLWRTTEDTDVRSEHRRLEGKFIPWNAPPVAGKGRGGVDQKYHAGQGPNCRCWPEPVIPGL